MNVYAKSFFSALLFGIIAALMTEYNHVPLSVVFGFAALFSLLAGPFIFEK